MADGNNLFVHPAVERMALRRRMAEAAEGLLEAAHAIIAELGRDAPDADLEPSLGAPESSARQVFDWACGVTDDREDAQDELEPSLGSSSALNQATWGAGSCSDLEHEHDGREPVSEDEGAQYEDEGGEHDGSASTSIGRFDHPFPAPSTPERRTEWARNKLSTRSPPTSRHR
jgi:hypothetical protein